MKNAKKILIVSSSLRAGSNSERLAQYLEEGASTAGNKVTLLYLKGKLINFCAGCMGCQNTGTCVIRDDMDAMIEQVKEADVIVFATPVYYYSVCGQLKTFLDRCNPLYNADYKFREVYLVTASAEEGEAVYQTTEACIRGWVDCFPKAAFRQTLSCGGLLNPNELKLDSVLLLQAYELGKTL